MGSAKVVIFRQKCTPQAPFISIKFVFIQNLSYLCTSKTTDTSSK